MPKEELNIDPQKVRDQLASYNAKASAPSQNMKEEEQPKRRFYTLSLAKIVAISAAAGVFVGLAVDTTAIREKSFFEITKSGPNSMRITVTGNEPEDSESIVRYDSWNQLPSDMQKPSYIPAGTEFNELYSMIFDTYTLYVGNYTRGLRIQIREAREGYQPELLDRGWDVKIVSYGTAYLQLDGNYKAVWMNGKYIYEIECDNLNKLQKIVQGMQK